MKLKLALSRRRCVPRTASPWLTLRQRRKSYPDKLKKRAGQSDLTCIHGAPNPGNILSPCLNLKWMELLQ